MEAGGDVRAPGAAITVALCGHTADLTFTRHDPADAETILDTVIVPVYVASHRDVIDQPFSTHFDVMIVDLPLGSAAP